MTPVHAVNEAPQQTAVSQNNIPEPAPDFDQNDYTPKIQPATKRSPPDEIRKEMRKLTKCELILLTTQSFSQAVMPQLTFNWGFLPIMWGIAYISFLTLLRELFQIKISYYSTY